MYELIFLFVNPQIVDYLLRTRRLCRSAWVGVSSPSVCLFVCLFVRSITQKTNDPKVFKLGIGNNLGIP